MPGFTGRSLRPESNPGGFYRRGSPGDVQLLPVDGKKDSVVGSRLPGHIGIDEARRNKRGRITYAERFAIDVAVSHAMVLKAEVVALGTEVGTQRKQRTPEGGRSTTAYADGQRHGYDG